MKFIEPSVTIVKGLSPLQKIALIARVCTGTQDKAESSPEVALPFLRKLGGMGHLSPFEHARIAIPLPSIVNREEHGKECFNAMFPVDMFARIHYLKNDYYTMNVRDFIAQGGTFEDVLQFEEATDYFTACFTIDIGIARELIRHRSMSFMERSTRWCSWSEENGGIEFIKPEDYHESTATETDYDHAFELAETFYFGLLKRGVRREMARSVLPLATATKLYVTGTYQHWTWLLNLRLGKRAHPAMRRVMNQLIEQPDFPKNEMPIKEAAN